MGVPYFAVGTVGLDHHAVYWHQFEHFQVLGSLERASIDSHMQVQGQDLLQLLFAAGEGMHDSCAEHMPVLLHDIIEITAGVSVVQVHGQLVFPGQLEVPWENLKLLFLARPLQPVVVQAALPDSHKVTIDSVGGILHLLDGGFYLLEVMVDSGVLIGIEGLAGSAGVDSNRCIAVVVLLAHLVGQVSILEVSCSDEQVMTPHLFGPLDDTAAVVGMVVLPVVTSELPVGEIGSNVIEPVVGALVWVVVGNVEALLLGLVLLCFGVLLLVFWLHLG